MLLVHLLFRTANDKLLLSQPRKFSFGTCTSKTNGNFVSVEQISFADSKRVTSPRSESSTPPCGEKRAPLPPTRAPSSPVVQSEPESTRDMRDDDVTDEDSAQVNGDGGSDLPVTREWQSGTYTC